MAEQQDDGWRPGCGHGRFHEIHHEREIYCTDCKAIRPGPPGYPLPPAMRDLLDTIADNLGDPKVPHERRCRNAHRELRRILDRGGEHG